MTDIKLYKCTITITDGEQTNKQDFYVEAESFDEAVEKVKSDLDLWNSSKIGKDENMEIKINLSESDLDRIRDVLGITEYNDIHTSIVKAYGDMLDKKEGIYEPECKL